ncbi:MAG TPA: hypothetical protein VGC13_09240 [Longimicrobium sp.]|jgi:hypothetical protein|uniref:hypothetical protein n=1 Tax=Longimicrobium sp. TaxID=2029185 RepID=UPI002EDAE155
MRFRTLVRRTAPLLALALALGCADANNSGSSDGGLPTLTESGIYNLLSARAVSAEQSEVTLSLKQLPGGIELASAQGELQYDAAALQLVLTALPEGIEGDVVEVSPGRVRFVATLVQGMAEPAILRLQFRGRETPLSLARDMFSVRLEEVSGGADLADVTSTVRSERLLFVQGQ